MNLKVKAGLITVGMLGIAVSTILAIRLALTYISAEHLPIIGMVCFLSFMLYLMYSITLDRLEHDAKIKELVDRNRN